MTACPHLPLSYWRTFPDARPGAENSLLGSDEWKEEICNADAMHLELMAKLQNASIARWLVAMDIRCLREML